MADRPHPRPRARLHAVEVSSRSSSTTFELRSSERDVASAACPSVGATHPSAALTSSRRAYARSAHNGHLSPRARAMKHLTLLLPILALLAAAPAERARRPLGPHRRGPSAARARGPTVVYGSEKKTCSRTGGRVHAAALRPRAPADPRRDEGYGVGEAVQDTLSGKLRPHVSARSGAYISILNQAGSRSPGGSRRSAPRASRSPLSDRHRHVEAHGREPRWPGKGDRLETPRDQRDPKGWARRAAEWGPSSSATRTRVLELGLLAVLAEAYAGARKTRWPHDRGPREEGDADFLAGREARWSTTGSRRASSPTRCSSAARVRLGGGPLREPGHRELRAGQGNTRSSPSTRSRARSVRPPLRGARRRVGHGGHKEAAAALSRSSRRSPRSSGRRARLPAGRPLDPDRSPRRMPRTAWTRSSRRPCSTCPTRDPRQAHRPLEADQEAATSVSSSTSGQHAGRAAPAGEARRAEVPLDPLDRDAVTLMFFDASVYPPSAHEHGRGPRRALRPDRRDARRRRHRALSRRRRGAPPRPRRARPTRADPRGRRHDGRPGHGQPRPRPRPARAPAARGRRLVRVFTIGYGPSADEGVLKRIAEAGRARSRRGRRGHRRVSRHGRVL